MDCLYRLRRKEPTSASHQKHLAGLHAAERRLPINHKILGVRPAFEVGHNMTAPLADPHTKPVQCFDISTVVRNDD